MRLFCLSCRSFFFMYTQIFLTISVLGNGLLPTTFARASLTVSGVIKAALGFRADFFFAAFLGVAFLAAFLGAAFFAAFLAAFLGAFLATFFAAFLADFAIMKNI